MTCDKIKLCKECNHHMAVFVDIYCWDNKCGRLQKKICDKIYGTLYYPSYRKLLNCESERQESKDIMEWIVGERKDKCGKEGKYWRAKDDLE